MFARRAVPRRVQQRALPYYQKHDTRSWKLWVLALIGLFVGGATWFLLASPALAVHEVEVIGLQRIPRAEVVAMVDDALNGRWLTVFSRRAILLVPTDAIERSIASMPAVRSVRVSRKLPGRIEVDVEERIASVQWESAGQAYEVDLEGKVIRPLAPAEELSASPTLPRIVSEANATTTVGDTVASPEIIELAIQAAPGPQGRGSDFASPGTSPSELFIHTGDTKVLLTTNKPLDEQYQSAQSVLASVPRQDVSKIELIDVRLPELPTYKLR